MLRRKTHTHPIAALVRLFIVLAALLAALLLGATAVLAQSPTSTGTPAPSATPTAMPAPSEVTQVPVTPESILFPFQLVLTGPSQAVAGEPASYNLRYARVITGLGGGTVFQYGRDATLISMNAIEGAPPRDLGEQNPAQPAAENIQFQADAGNIEFVIVPHAGFTGILDVSVYVKGTSIKLPDGSVVFVRTQVVSPSAKINLPPTGAGPASGASHPSWRDELAGVLGALGLALMAAVVARVDGTSRS